MNTNPDKNQAQKGAGSRSAEPSGTSEGQGAGASSGGEAQQGNQIGRGEGGIKLPDSPKIELPKGGGAIRGMGEKFQANPVTGTGSFSAPIAMTPGRAGFTPALGLSYNSGSGSSPFGLGWSVGTPSISRKTSGELPRYQDGDESDTFLMSGAEDLIPQLKDNSGTWIRDAFEYPTTGTATHQVFRYRPRTEGLFARIERWVDLSTGAVHWRSITRDNVTSFYGRTDESRIQDPEDSSKVFQWLIDESRDDKGNAMVYRYQKEDEYGIANTLPETNRLDGSSQHFAQRYLKNVYYGNTVMTNHVDYDSTNEWCFQLAFDHGDLSDDDPTYDSDPEWDVRQDAFSTYRAGFEVRTWRLCKRILMFHNFTELGSTPTLVKSTELNYDENPTNTRLTSVVHLGHDGAASEALPALDFTYSEATMDDKLQHFDVEDLENLPIGVDGQQYLWSDLYGEGITGVLTEEPGGWFYKRNEGDEAYYEDHSVANPPPPELRFGAQTSVASKPNMGGVQQVGDFNGDGQTELLIRSRELNGYFTLENKAGIDPSHPQLDNAWSRFKHLENVPLVNWDDPNLRLIDLNGDGVPDILLSEDYAFRYWPSTQNHSSGSAVEGATEGFGDRIDIPLHHDEAQGPKLVFADAEQVIHLADMSGDGLTDLVRVRNGSVCYWPNLGYGRFGKKVSMDGSPQVDFPGIFDRSRIRLVDMDGSGTTDLVYLGGDKVSYWNNQSGNGYSLEKELIHFPKTNNMTAVSAIDLFGKGTSCLVWSSPLAGDIPHRVKYIDLFGEKPYLLKEVNNNMGGIHRYHYAPSTKFYLRDRQQGRPWITKLPFPVQVVERTEQYDQVTGARFVSRYAYHHGYFDRHEQEFRGFGMVEQWDTEQYENFAEDGLFQVGSNALDEDSHIPPVHTKSWFHLGFYEAEGTITQQYASEYYKGDSAAWELPDSQLPSGLSAEETRQAMRALKGQLLRSEVYADDDSAEASHPYTVSAANYLVKQIQPSFKEVLGAEAQILNQRNHSFAAFQVIPQESLSYQYERNPDDPRIAHSMVLATDLYGTVTQAAAIAYPRRGSNHPVNQSRGIISISENNVIHKDDDTNKDQYRLGIPNSSYSYELTGVTFPSAAPLTIVGISDDFGSASTIDYSVTANHSSLQKRVIGAQMMQYRQDTGSGTLTYGSAGYLAMPFRVFVQALTAPMRDTIYNFNGAQQIGNTELISNDLSYSKISGIYWAESDRLTYDSDSFFLLDKVGSAMGGATAFTYDSYGLAVIKVVDPFSNTTFSTINYRVMSASEIKDPNGNRQQVGFDVLGMVAKVAVMGKTTESLGDTLSDPTQKFSYELNNWQGANPTPNMAKSEVRENHGGTPTWLTSYEYSGGFGQVILQKVQAEPGEAPERDSGTGELVYVNDELQYAPADPRWVGNGRTIFNNKGKAVKQYEPYFSDTHAFEDEDEVRQHGVTPVVHYDPLGRVIRTDMPDGTFTIVAFDCWQQANYDQNDTVLHSTWFSQKLNPASIPTSEPTNAGERAAWLALKHYNTPQLLHMDVLGRVFKTQDNNGTFDSSSLPAGQAGSLAELASIENASPTQLAAIETATTDEHYDVTVELDIESKRKKVTNELGQETVFTYSMLPLNKDGAGQVLYTDSPDGGWRRAVFNTDGLPWKAWNERGFTFRNEYDTLDRPTHAWMDDGTAGEKLVGFTVYGDSSLVTSGATNNLLGQAVRSYDQSGVAKLVAVDFKGNVRIAERELSHDYENALDWSTITSATTLAALDTAADGILDPGTSNPEAFTTSVTYDALNRPTSMTLPDSTEVKPTYNEATFLETVEARIRGEASWTTFVSNIDYDVKGQREKIVYGNNAETTYSYDPKTFRLTRLFTTRPDTAVDTDTDPDVLQDLNYYFDAIGNIVEMEDDAQQVNFFKNAVVSPNAKYTYDALYRLISATGREHAGNGQLTETGMPYNTPVPHVNNSTAVETYTESYEYDAIGNILKLIHNAASGNWTRGYHYDTSTNNYLLKTSLPGDDVNDHTTYSASYTYDVHGNTLSMPHLSDMQWDFADQLKEVDLGGGGTAYYVYSGGQRIRKVIVNGSLVKDRIYLGGNEIYREYVSGSLDKERESLHIMDDTRRIALVETLTVENREPVTTPTPVIKYQLGNHLDSASLELDASANVITYEEYHPFGTSAYRLGKSSDDISLKRYRYVGKEHDDETGLYYYGARYHCPWMCRFISVDPRKDDYPFQNSYAYAANNPINLMDVNGEGPDDPEGEPTITSGSNFPTSAQAGDIHISSKYGGQLAPNGQGITGTDGTGLSSFFSGDLTSLMFGYVENDGYGSWVVLGFETEDGDQFMWDNDAMWFVNSATGKEFDDHVSMDVLNAVGGGMTPMINMVTDWAEGKDPFADLKLSFAEYGGSMSGFALHMAKQSVKGAYNDLASGGHSRSQMLLGGLGYMSTPGFGISAAASSQFRRFYSVLGDVDFNRLKKGGAPWPTDINKTFVGQGLYSFGGLSDAKKYLPGSLSLDLTASIRTFDISLGKLKKMPTLDLSKLSDDAASNLLNSPIELGKYQHIRRTTNMFGTEYFFDKSTLGSFKF